MNSKISDKDKKDWEEFLLKDQKLPNKDNSKKKLKRGKVISIDLHGYTLKEANQTVEKFINESFENNISKLIIVTGKGLHSNNTNDPYVSKNLSILKYSVPEFIKKNQELMMKIYDIKEADIKDGGDGAFYIFLKKNNLFI
ncbi:Smr/MutS family protein [Pelagibacterales bacterium SAG-MED12]|nr:Smr/MutS family protein [Pelagibacterales bacterium SAG-MED12]